MNDDLEAAARHPRLGRVPMLYVGRVRQWIAGLGEWHQPRPVASGIHICVFDLGHFGDCLCGTCGAHFKPTGVLGEPKLPP